MVTHRIDLGPQRGGKKRTPCLYLGAEILLTAQPIYACARYLLDYGLADPHDKIETWRDDMKCMFGQVGDCASGW